ncbi:MAG: caspase family protein, partial [Gemmatimonadales bacterium]
SSSKGVSRVVVALNGTEISRQEERAPRGAVAVNLPVTLREGQNTLVVTASDVDGTISQEVRTVYFEKRLPLAVAFRYPQDMARVTDAATVVAAIVTSSKGVAKVSVNLNGAEVHQQSERSLEKSVVLTLPIKLREGANTIGITASEPDGTVRQELRTVIFDRPQVAVASPPPAPPPPQAAPNRWAVVIGVGGYDSADIPKLRYAVPDAEAIYQVLTGAAGFKKEHVLLLTDKTERKPTLRNIRWALGTFLARSARRDDTVVIFFAGHGAPEADLRGIERDGLAKYLIPVDADAEDLYSSALPMDELQKIFGRIEAERVVAFLDTCYSGAAGGRTFLASRTRSSQVDDLFLERLTRSKGRAIITASRPAEVSMELPELGHGIFTYYLLEGLKGAADLNKDGIVTLQELYEYLEQQVTQKSRSVGGNQHPVMKGELEGVLPLVKVKGR